ncbi:MAG: hypothetical protein KIY12_03380 [Thermoplasmata archaeon]|uniref:Uncharacterized protein n=1 Tax=Candidatus Sysuiplasma superficiale TaxID=2823368 RepID=A0A8J7YI82_9ARCH|nr:hypothetical protein [Candidatus Sysuiplasma superficiale]MBX8643748.1 hypothetical protein [Candidatus Sysuiplasma superficiale]MCL4346802.1 hypothetical protein [Candidatus Thermoplasmatota archaeon]
MTVKDKVGRRRYVAIEIQPSPQGSEDAVRLLGVILGGQLFRESRMKLISAEGSIAIVRCSHVLLPRVISEVNAYAGRVKCRTLLTSGTLRSLRQSLHMLDGKGG